MPLNNTGSTSQPFLENLGVLQGTLQQTINFAFNFIIWVEIGWGIVHLAQRGPKHPKKLMIMYTMMMMMMMISMIMMMMMTTSMKILAREASLPVNIPTLGQGSLH